MTLWMMGGGGWQPPFNRTFFNASLAELLERAGRGTESRLTLYLVDGSQLDVRAIESLSDQFLTVRAAFRDEGESELSVHALPYSSVYRVEVARAADGDVRKLGFRRSSLAARSHTPGKGRTSGIAQPVSDGASRTEEPSLET